MCLPTTRKKPRKCGFHTNTYPQPCSLSLSPTSPSHRSRPRFLPSFSSSGFQSHDREVQRTKTRAHESVMCETEAVGAVREKVVLSAMKIVEDRVEREREWQQMVEKLENERKEREQKHRERKEREREQRIAKLEQDRKDRDERDRRDKEDRERHERENYGFDLQAVRKMMEDDRKQRELGEAVRRELEKMSGVGMIGYMRYSNGEYGVGNHALAAPVRQGLIADPDDAMDHPVSRLESRQRNIELDQNSIMWRQSRRLW